MNIAGYDARSGSPFPSGAESRREFFPLVDVVKVILSAMVVAIHVSPVDEPIRSLLLPILRIAVPIFFLLSSFFLSRKLASKQDVVAKRAVLFRFVKRNICLYLFWYIALFVPTLFLRREAYEAFLSYGLLKGVFLYIMTVLFGSTFRVSWFLSATCIGAVIVYVLEYKRSLCFAICGVSFIICCFASNYYGIAPSWLVSIFHRFSPIGTLYNSFPAALLWMLIGNEVGKVYSSRLRETLYRNRLILFVLALIGALVLYIEHSVIEMAGCARADDCYFSLIIVCLPLFLIIISVAEEGAQAPPIYRFMRAASTVTYCLHATLAYILTICFNFHAPSVTFYLLVLLLCWLCAMVIICLEKAGIRYLRFAY